MLEEESGVVVEEFSIRPSLFPQEIEKVTASDREQGIEVPEDVMNFYLVCNGFTFKWDLKKMKGELTRKLWVCPMFFP